MLRKRPPLLWSRHVARGCAVLAQRRRPFVQTSVEKVLDHGGRKGLLFAQKSKPRRMRVVHYPRLNQ